MQRRENQVRLKLTNRKIIYFKMERSTKKTTLDNIRQHMKLALHY